MNELCIMMLVNKRYTPYVPWFIFFAAKAYPEYPVRVYSTDPLAPGEKKSLEALQGMSDWWVGENCFQRYKHDAFVLKSLRWLIYPSEVLDFQNVYIGDIDMLLFRESPTLLDYHLARCEQLKLPYSNRVRAGSDMKDAEARLMGVHFAKNEWFAQTQFIRQKYLAMAGTPNLRVVVKTASNEGLLYQIAKQRFGLPPVDPTPVYEYHGIHLGIWRDPARRDPATVLDREKYRQQIYPDAYLGYYAKYCELKSTPEFQFLWRQTPGLQSVFRCMEQFSEYLKSNVKRYYP